MNLDPRSKMIKMHYMNSMGIITTGDIIEKSDDLANQI
jgi:hypothetical protein